MLYEMEVQINYLTLKGRGEKLAPVFTNRNRSHPAYEHIAQATQGPDRNSPNCRVGRPRDAPLPSFFRRGSWQSKATHLARLAQAASGQLCRRPTAHALEMLSKSDLALVPSPEEGMQSGDAVPRDSSRCRGPRPQPPCPGSRRPGLCWPYL